MVSNTDTSTENLLPGLPLVESPLFSTCFGPDGPNSDISEIASYLHEHGYVVLKNFIPDGKELCDKIVSDLMPEFDEAGWRENKRTGVTGGLRLRDTFDRHESVRKLASAKVVIELLSRLYGRQAFPFQTLNFPVGTEQHYHSDSIHFSSYPERFMCGVWVALEDIGEEQGPLEFYPGSHRLPTFENAHFGINTLDKGTLTQVQYHRAWEAMVRALKLQPKYFLAEKGDVLIWCANLLHGGSSHKNVNKTRWSQVTHYYFADCCYYTPMHSDTFVGRVAWRKPHNQIDSSPVENSFLGRPLAVEVARIPATHSEKVASLPADFDPERYLQLYADLRVAKVNPTEHYLNFGRHEGRRYK